MIVAPGLMVTPNVQLIRLLGEGGMGEVWLARHRTLNSLVAVKFVSTDEPARVELARERLRAEATATAMIRTPHVVKVFDQGTLDDGSPFVVLEYLEGESLGDRLDRVGRLDLSQCALIAAHMGRALHAAHSAGVVHRDIKPDNIFLARQDDTHLLVKLLDFGIARTAALRADQRLTAEGVVIGTPQYICRDVLVGVREPTSAMDLWSLAVVLWECLVGHLPWDGETTALVISGVLSESADPPSQFRDDLPPELDDFFRRALAWETEDRYQTALELAEAFLLCLPREIADELSVEVTGSHVFSLPPSTSQEWELGQLMREGEPSGVVPGDDLDAVMPGDDGGDAAVVAAPPEVRSPSPTLGGSTSLVIPPKRSVARWLWLGAVAVVVTVGGYLSVGAPYLGSDPEVAQIEPAAASSAEATTTATASTTSHPDPEADPPAPAAPQSSTATPVALPSVLPPPQGAGRPPSKSGKPKTAVAKPSPTSPEVLGF